MTHFKVEILLPRTFNLEDGETERKEIPKSYFHDTYEELLDIAGGVSTTDSPVIGSWISGSKKRYDDKSIGFSVVVTSDNRVNATSAPLIKKLQEYKKVLKERFKQEEIFVMVTRCCWI